MKTNWFKKVVAVVCTGLMVCGLMTGCAGGKGNGNKVDNSVEDTKNLKIMVYGKGYGTAWLTKLAEAFEAKNEGVNVDVQLVLSGDVISSDIQNVENSDTDLYFDCQISTGVHGLMGNYATAYKNGQVMRDLTHLLKEEVPGEGVLLGDKMNPSLKAALTVDGRNTEDTSDDTYYALPYLTGAMGLYYNETVIDKALGKGNWEVPNTTDELLALCKRLKAKDCHILLPGGLDTWAGSIFLSWWAQYEGMENYYKFFDGTGYDATKGREVANSNLIFKQPGRLASLETSYDLLSYESGYILGNSAEINVNNLNEYQTRFTLQKYNYALYPCGDWLMQELENNATMPTDSVIKMMKIPVISSIINSTDSYSVEGTKRLPNVTSDAVLSQVIDYVDGNGTLPAGVTEAEVAAVKEARNIYGTKSLEHLVYAPEFSNAKKLADQFLLFMATDEAIQIFKDNCDGGFSCYDYEYQADKLSATELSVYEATKDAIYVDDFKYAPLFYSTNVNAVAMGSDTLDGLLCRPKGKSGREIYEDFLESYSNVAWKNVLSQIAK